MGSGFIQKYKDRTRNRVMVQRVSHNPGQSIEAVSHINGGATQEVSQICTKSKHSFSIFLNVIHLEIPVPLEGLFYRQVKLENVLFL